MSDMKVSDKTEFQALSEKKGSPEYWEKHLALMNLGKKQILNQDLNQLKQSIISINSLLAKTNNEFSLQRKNEDIHHLDFDINAALLILIQRKTFIVDRYQVILKRNIIHRMKHVMERLADGETKKELDRLMTQLEYIECHRSNFKGKLQSLT